jgi:hypothetical protein
MELEINICNLRISLKEFFVKNQLTGYERLLPGLLSEGGPASASIKDAQATGEALTS